MFFYGVVVGPTACFAVHKPQLAMQQKAALVTLGPSPRNESNTFLNPEETYNMDRYKKNKPMLNDTAIFQL
jgi:hypothetical protein